MLAIAGVCLLGGALERRSGAERTACRSIALAMLVVILFPVISVSDDLWSHSEPCGNGLLPAPRSSQSGEVHSIFLDFAAFAVPFVCQFPSFHFCKRPADFPRNTLVPPLLRR